MTNVGAWFLGWLLIGLLFLGVATIIQPRVARYLHPGYAFFFALLGPFALSLILGALERRDEDREEERRKKGGRG